MVEEASRVEVFQLHVWIRGISPMIWRRPAKAAEDGDDETPNGDIQQLEKNL